VLDTVSENPFTRQSGVEGSTCEDENAGGFTNFWLGVKGCFKDLR